MKRAREDIKEEEEEVICRDDKVNIGPRLGLGLGLGRYVNNTNKMHPRNKHINPIDYKELSSVVGCEELAQYVYRNRYGTYSINYHDRNAVKCLTRCILLHLYNIKGWTVPDGSLIPPVPTRENYIHHIADLIGCQQSIDNNSNRIVVKGIDIGIGGNAIYSLLAATIYGWHMIGTDVSQSSIDNAQRIIDNNPHIKSIITIKKQYDKMKIFEGGCIDLQDTYTFSMCNPPFYDLTNTTTDDDDMNRNPYKDYGGSEVEMRCEGGEVGFLTRMLKESEDHPHLCIWFTSLCARRTTLKKMEKLMNKNPRIVEVKTIALYQGRQTRWVICWTFLNTIQRAIRLTSTSTTTTLIDEGEVNERERSVSSTSPFYTF